MSNIWKLYGLSCVDPSFVKDISILQTSLEKPTTTMQAAIAAIDDVFRGPKYRLPLGHLQIMEAYTILRNANTWTALNKIVTANVFGAVPAGLKADEFYRVIGLCCLDPWISGDPQAAVNPPGFRDLLMAAATSDDADRVVSDFGFLLDPGVAKQIHDGLVSPVAAGQPSVAETMKAFMFDWDCPTLDNMTNRSSYIDVCVPPNFPPPGWLE